MIPALRPPAGLPPDVRLRQACGPCDASFILNVQGSWLDPAESQTHIDWVRGFWQAMRPHSAGRAYMTELKARWDPTNLFRLNQNIEPDVPTERVA